MYQENKDLVLMGGYNSGQNEEIDKAINFGLKFATLLNKIIKKIKFNQSIEKIKNI